MKVSFDIFPFLDLAGKTAGEDKKLYKTLESKYVEEMESEVPDLSSTSPFGPLTQQASRKTLYHLIATLNSSFPDYDFRSFFFFLFISFLSFVLSSFFLFVVLLIEALN